MSIEAVHACLSEDCFTMKAKCTKGGDMQNCKPPQTTKRLAIRLTQENTEPDTGEHRA